MYCSSIHAPSRVSSRVEVLRAPYLTQLSPFMYSYNLDSLFLSVGVTLAVPLAMLPGRAGFRCQHWRKPQGHLWLPPLCLALGTICSRTQAWPADEAESRTRVWEGSLAELS
jgi:hypothetical protein